MKKCYYRFADQQIALGKKKTTAYALLERARYIEFATCKTLLRSVNIVCHKLQNFVSRRKISLQHAKF